MKRRACEESEGQYLDRFWEYQALQFENHTCAAAHRLHDLDAAIFACLQEEGFTHETDNRRAQVFACIRNRALIDHHPDVARLRNRIEEQFVALWQVPPDQRTTERRLEFANRLKPDVSALMRTRSAKAQELGLPSYVDAVMASEDLREESLKSLLEGFVTQHSVTAAALAKKHGVRLATWYSDIDRIDSECARVDPEDLIRQHLRLLGLEGARDRITVLCRERGLTGYTGVVSVPGDIRIVVRPINSLAYMMTLFHELGHALAHSLNQETGIYQTWTAAYDESMAVLMEFVALEAWPDLINAKLAGELLLLTHMECAVSALFELDLWLDPAEAAALYEKHYSRLGVDVTFPELWAGDAFRSLDPVYKHNYVLGHWVGLKTAEYLREHYCDDFPLWGRWLAENYYHDGRRRSLAEKAAELGKDMFK